MAYLAESHSVYSLQQLQEHFDNEQLLVILVSRLYFKKIPAAEVCSFIEENRFDWQKFRKLLAVHGIRPFIYQVVASRQLPVDAALQHDLKGFYLQNQVKCMEQMVITNRLQQSFMHKGILAIPYKGTLFANAYYHNIGLRESSDIDFIINKNDVDTAEKELLNIGCRPKTMAQVAYKKYFLKKNKDVSYTIPSAKNEKGYTVEMHFRLLDSFYGPYVDFSFFKNGISRRQVAGLSFNALQPTYDLLAVSSNHFIKDLAFRFKYLLDIASLINEKGDEIDITLVTQLMQQFHFRKRFEHGLFIIEAILGIELPAYQNKFSFSPGQLKPMLDQDPMKIKISDLRFLRRSFQLHDDLFSTLKFFLKGLWYYILPMSADIQPGKTYPIPLLTIMSLGRRSLKLFRISSTANRK